MKLIFKGFLWILKRVLCYLFFALLLTSSMACSSNENSISPPFVIPFDFKVEAFEVKRNIHVKEYRSYEIGVKLQFTKNNIQEKNKLLIFTGDYGRDSAGHLIKPSIPLKLKVEILSSDLNSAKTFLGKNYHEMELDSISDDSIYLTLDRIVLKPGKYQMVFANGMQIFELSEYPAFVYMSFNSKISEIGK